MGNHPINLILRFFLELAAWVAMGYWGFTRFAGLAQWVIGLGLPILAMAIWESFRTPGQGGKGRFPVPGWLRLLIEAATFIGAIYLLFDAGKPTISLIFAGIVFLHYAASYDYIRFLLTGRPMNHPMPFGNSK